MITHACYNLIWTMQVKMVLWAWWRHEMAAFSALLVICAGHSAVTGEFPSQRPATRSFDAFFDMHLNKRLSKQSRGWWVETESCPLWRHFNGSTSPYREAVTLQSYGQAHNDKEFLRAAFQYKSAFKYSVQQALHFHCHVSDWYIT